MSQALILTTKLQEERDYWTARLARELTGASISTDLPRSKVYSLRQASVNFRLEDEAARRLTSLTGGSPFLIYTTLLAALKICLYKYSGSRAIVVGSPAHRAPGAVTVQPNALAILDELEDDMSFQELLRRVRDSLTQGYERQSYPFANLLEDLGLSETGNKCPLFDIAVSLDEIHAELPDVRNDIHLEFKRRDEAIEGVLKFNARLFRRETMERFAGHFSHVLDAALSNTKLTVREFSVTTEAERRQLLFGWNATAGDYPRERCVHELFEAQVERTPAALAVKHGERLVTYAELNACANRLARHLLTLGVRPEVRVGICVERTVEMMVGLLAILKAGGAYVPLDVAYPQERLAFMLEDAQAAVLLTQRRMLDNLPAHSAQVVCLDTDWEMIARESDANLASGANPDNGAYVLYTSGSTGRPKGVTMPHRPLVNLISWQNLQSKNSGVLRTAQFTSLSFDVSFQEIFSTWCAGAMLVLLEEEVRRDPVSLRRFLADEEIERLFLPFIALQQLAELSDTQAPVPSKLREVVTAGEQLQVTPALVNLFRQLGDCTLDNHYGPTEGHVVSSFQLEDAPSRWPTLPPIGRPVTNARLYIADAQMQPVPVGLPGELFIGGVSLARGYHNRPDLTAEKFVPDPFGGEPGGRLYRTGDMARRLPSGDIEYLGRNDHQVKVRGFRVELGEIEAALSRHAAVRETVVMPREDVPGDKRLVAYVVASQGGLALPGELRAFLKERLPEHMLPAAFVVLDALPLTPTGKVDRRALPAPDRSRAASESQFAAPRTPVEELLCGIWSESLGVERVGINDNFFELGGDSILTIQVVAKANRAGLNLVPKLLFQHQTVAALALVAQNAPATQGEQGIVTGTFPLTPIQHWFFEQNLPEPHHFNMGYLFEVRQEFAASVWRRGVEMLVAHHDALRLRFIRRESGWEQSNAGAEDAAPFAHVDLSALPEAEHEREIKAIATRLQTSLNLSEGPLLRVALFDFGAGKAARLLVLVHHLVMDGVSWRILLEDLQAITRSLARGERVELSPKTTSFKDWAERLVAHAQSNEVQQELSFWFSKTPETESYLPVDYEGGANLESSASILSVVLDREETEALLREVPRVYNARINDVLLTALTRAFAGWTGGRSLLVDLEGHGREEPDSEVNLSRTVGWFTTMTRVLLELGGTDTPGEALKAVREELRRIPNHGLGYGLLRYLSDDATGRARLAAMRRADVCFNYLGQTDQIFPEDALLMAVNEPIGSIQSPNGRLPHLLYVNGIIFEGQLRMRFRYSSDSFKSSTVDALAQAFLDELRTLIAHCRAVAVADYAPANFPLAQLDQDDLERAFAQVRFEKEASRIDLRQIEDAYPLSPSQEGILFHSLYAPASGVYVTQMSCTFQDLNESAVERAWEAVIERHPILRTAFAWEHADKPLQVVAKHITLPLEKFDWRGLSPEEQQQRFELHLQQDRARGFKLSNVPLMRLTLFRTADDTHQFLWSHHHVLLDGWSIFLILKDVFSFYDAFSREQELQLEPASPFRNYIEWMQNQNLSGAEAFWRHALKGVTVPTPLGVDRQSASGGDESYDEKRLYLPQDTLNDLQTLARQQQLTLNTVVQGAWALLLGHYSKQREVLFGATVSGRPADLAGIESMVGIFINVLPMRVEMSPDGMLLDWLKKIQGTHVEVRQYEYSPLAQVQRWSEVPRGLPLFESILTFQNYPVDDKLQDHSQSLSISNVRHSSQTNYPLTIIVGPGRGLLLRAIYDGRRFESSTITKLLDDLATLLRNFVRQPTATLDALKSLLTQSEQTERRVGQQRREVSNRMRLKDIKPKAVVLPQGELVRREYLSPEQPFPLVVKPARADVDLIDWARGNRELIESELTTHGAILFRDFNVDSVARFERFALNICPDLFGEYGDLPREGVAGKVYRSTPYPSDKAILMHNESSHLHRWPLKICFYCVEAAAHGGETPIVDCRKLYQLLDPSLRGRFEHKGIMYVRNYIEGIDVSWQSFFRTTDKAEVEQFCRDAAIGFQWKQGNQLRTSQIRPAVMPHPKTGEMLFFNQLQLHHVSCLDPAIRESLLSTFTVEDLPRNVYYGDGTPIEDSVIEEIREASRQATTAFPWQPRDILILDNMRIAHGRNPYTGARKVVVAMGEMMTDANLEQETCAVSVE